jgi:hypothetical protein
MMIDAPEPIDVLERMGSVEVEDDGRRRSIATLRESYRDGLKAAREEPSLSIFCRFVNFLLERASAQADRRLRRFEREKFASFDAITEECVSSILGQTGYRFPKPGLKVVMDSKQIVTDSSFVWSSYIEEAERSYESDFPNDKFLEIKNVGFKTRDLALSELSDRYAAIDLHVVRVISRTGLLVHGFGDLNISTDVRNGRGYMFFHALVLKLARRTGWPDSGYSPGEIDKMIWRFGVAVCKADPVCGSCPVAGNCLTAMKSCPQERYESQCLR